MINTGSITEHVKGYLEGTWSSEGLDSSVFRIEKLERKVADTWVTVDYQWFKYIRRILSKRR